MNKGDKNMSTDPTTRDEMNDYIKAHLLSHMREGGMSEKEIEAHIASMNPYHPLKAHFVGQYIESLPADQREEATMRLLPPIAGSKMKITVLSVSGKPTFEVSANLVAQDVDAIVRNAYGRRSDGSPHNWRGDPVESDE